VVAVCIFAGLGSLITLYFIDKGKDVLRRQFLDALRYYSDLGEDLPRRRRWQCFSDAH
jgi:hypothetical protein